MPTPAAGAAAISVLTEPTFFDGAPAHLAAVRAAVDIPVLRKDFIVTDYQLVEAVDLGADAALLIVSALDGRGAARRCSGPAASLGLAALVEVHDDDEADARAGAGATIVGVNCRNLRTLSVDPAVPRGGRATLPAGVDRGGRERSADAGRPRSPGRGRATTRSWSASG